MSFQVYLLVGWEINSVGWNQCFKKHGIEQNRKYGAFHVVVEARFCKSIAYFRCRHRLWVGRCDLWQ